MKTATLVFVLGVVISLHGLHAGELEELAVVAEAYTQLGDDNNYVDYDIMSVAEFEQYKPEATSIASDTSGPGYDVLIDALAQCVFMREGAYGDHFSEELAQRIVNRFYGKMRYGTDLLSKANLYRMDAKTMGLSSGIFGAPCIFAIQRENQVLVLQASAMD